MRIPLLILALSLAALPAAAQHAGDHPPGDSVRYVAISAGRVSGSEVFWRDPDGTLHSRMEYNDRGRGPAIHTRVRLDERGESTASRRACPQRCHERRWAGPDNPSRWPGETRPT